MKNAARIALNLYFRVEILIYLSMRSYGINRCGEMGEDRKQVRGFHFIHWELEREQTPFQEFYHGLKW